MHHVNPSPRSHVSLHARCYSSLLQVRRLKGGMRPFGFRAQGFVVSSLFSFFSLSFSLLGCSKSDFFGLNCCTICCNISDPQNHFVEPSSGGTLRGLLFFQSLFFFFFLFFCFVFDCFIFLTLFLKKCSLHSGRSNVTRVTVGRGHQSFRVSKVHLATLKVGEGLLAHHAVTGGTTGTSQAMRVTTPGQN